ncbi:hypothetical protein JHK84_050619 [Glycine max]|nr:hypothetical protein JHK84_050619 [Glycine max]
MINNSSSNDRNVEHENGFCENKRNSGGKLHQLLDTSPKTDVVAAKTEDVKDPMVVVADHLGFEENCKRVADQASHVALSSRPLVGMHTEGIE